MERKNQAGIKDAISVVIDLVNNWKKVVDILEILIATYGAYKAAQIVNNIIEEANAVGSLAKFLKEAAIAQKALNMIQSASPIGLVFAAITAAIGALALYQKGTFKAKTATEEINESIGKEVLSMNSLFDRVKKTEVGTKEHAEAVKLVNDRYGSYLGNPYRYKRWPGSC